jgi:hypothetical protein
MLFLSIKGRVYMYSEDYIGNLVNRITTLEQEIPEFRCVNAFGLALRISDLASGWKKFWSCAWDGSRFSLVTVEKGKVWLLHILLGTLGFPAALVWCAQVGSKTR